MDDLNINDLPPEVLSMIFNCLSVNDKFNVVQKVCKKWYFIVTNSKLRNLVIAQDHLPLNEKWSFTWNQVNCACSIVDLNLNFIETQLKRDIFSNLKSLYLYTINLSYLTSSFIECLNRLQFLERLEISFILLNKIKTLNLFNLQVFSVKKVHGNLLILNTPKLSKLRIQSANCNNLKFIFPETIEYLDCAEFEIILNKFKNLKILFCLDMIDINNDLLINLIKLEEVHFERNHFTFYNLVNQKRIFNRTNLDIYYQGLKSGDYLEQNLNFGSDSLNEANIQIYLNNYSNVANQLTFIKYINYNCWELNDSISPGIPEDFIRKFVCLNGIWVTHQVNNELKFIDFLKNCSNYSFLKLNYSQLTQAFYSQLPTLCPTIKNLEIKEEPEIINNLDFDFLIRFNYLTGISTNKKLSIEFMYQIFRELNLCNLTFQCKTNFNRHLNSNDQIDSTDETTIKIHHFKNNFEVCLKNEIYFFDTLDDLYCSLKELKL